MNMMKIEREKMELNCCEKYSATEFLFKLKVERETQKKVKNDVKRTLSSLKLKCFQ